MAEVPREEELKDKLESGQTIGQDDIRFLVDQSSISQRLLSGFGFIGTFSDELSETGRETLVASGAKADIGVQVIMGNLGISTDEINENLQIGIATPFGGASGRQFGAATVGRGKDIFLRDIMSQKTPLGRGVWRAIAEHKRGIALGAGAGVGLFALGQASEPEEPGRGPGVIGGKTLGEGASTTDPVDGTILYVDPTTGEVTPITIEPGLTDNFGVGPSGSVPSLSPDLLALAGVYGIDASQLQSGVVNETFLTGLNQWGEGSISPSARPFGVTARGGVVPSDQAFRSRRERKLEGADRFFPSPGKEAFIESGAVAPPGATLNRRVFEERDGKTNLERAAVRASTYGVPLDILYGTVNALSGWNADAVGNNGTTFGLAQIPLEVAVVPENAIDPNFALAYLSNRLRINFQEYGNWEMAALAYRSPGEAERFLTTGTMDPLSKAFLQDVLGGSQASGLGNNIFDFAGLAAVPSQRGDGGGGPRIPPFQAPDPAELREFSRSAFASILGRDPTDDELTTGVDELTKGFRLAYDAQVTKLRGGKSTDVNPEARFVEQLETSGEAEFRQEVVTQRSVFDQMGDWARVLGEF